MVVDKLTVSVEEAGVLLGISRGLAYELVRRGELPHLRLGRRVVVPVHSLMALVDSGGQTVGQWHSSLSVTDSEGMARTRAYAAVSSHIAWLETQQRL